MFGGGKDREEISECRFCKEPHGDFITDGLFEQCRLVCLHDITSNRSRWTLCINNSAYASIRYCPMCGRKFEE